MMLVPHVVYHYHYSLPHDHHPHPIGDSSLGVMREGEAMVVFLRGFVGSRTLNRGRRISFKSSGLPVSGVNLSDVMDDEFIAG